MSDSATDFYHEKTDAQLLYFVEHPELYQPDLVAAARRELRRRGVQITEPELAVAPVLYTPSRSRAPARSSKSGAFPLALGAILLASLVSYFVVKGTDQPAAKAVVKTRKAPPRLVEVPTNAIPNFDGAVAKAVNQQLSLMPAAEKSNPQHLRQFRELCKRFWTAETQTEFLVNQAHQGTTGPMYTEQAYMVREVWQSWNHANPYTYNFGPRMTEHLDRMRSTASSQQHILNNMPALLIDRKFLTDKEMQSREADVQYWLSELLPASPVTGRSYQAKAMTITM